MLRDGEIQIAISVWDRHVNNSARNRREGSIGYNGDSCVEKQKSCLLVSQSKMKLWMIRSTTMVLLWILLGPVDDIGELLGPS